MSAAAGLCMRTRRRAHGQKSPWRSPRSSSCCFPRRHRAGGGDARVIVYRFYRSNPLSQEATSRTACPSAYTGFSAQAHRRGGPGSLLTGACIYGCLFGVAFRAEIWAQVLSELRAWRSDSARPTASARRSSPRSCSSFAAAHALGRSRAACCFSLPGRGAYALRHKLLASLGIFLALGLASQLLTMLLTLATGWAERLRLHPDAGAAGPVRTFTL